MPRFPIRLSAVLGLHLLLGLGCMVFPWEDDIIIQALDYRIDRPRLLALAVNPPVMRAGQEVSMEALVLAPGGLQASEGSWKTCGLNQGGWTSIWGLECFAEDADVSSIAEGTPTTWVPPRSGLECEEGGYGYDDYWYYWKDCAHSLPFLYEVELGGETVRGTFGGYLSDDPLEPRNLPTSLREIPLELTVGEPVDGEVLLEAWLGSEQQYARFRWYVDDGTLLDTGRTAVHGTRDGGSWSDNRWVLPEEPGSYRVVVVMARSDVWGELAAPVDSGPKDTAWWNDTWAEAADMTWAIVTVEVE
jgi:hypothetical protein